MESLIYSIAGFLVALAILVAVHEFGHFWVARKLGVKVLRFSIGFGKPLLTRTGKVDQTEYVLAAIPLGGYVKMLDEADEVVSEKDLPRAFNRQPLWKRSLIVLAGPAFNFLFAIFTYAAVYMVGIEGLVPEVGQVAPGSIAEQAGLKSGDEIIEIDGRPNQSWSDQRLYLLDRALGQHTLFLTIRRSGEAVERHLDLDLSKLSASQIDGSIMETGLGIYPWFPAIPAEVGSVQQGSPANAAGIEPGDRIISIDGQAINDWPELVTYVAARPGTSLDLALERPGLGRLQIDVTTRIYETGGQKIGRLGIGRTEVHYPEERLVSVKSGVVQSIWRGVETTWLMSTVTVRMLWHMLKLDISTENLSGPITIAQFAGQAAQVGVDRFMLLLAVISVSLGVLNLLPVPMLDGGHLLYYIVEAIRGKPLSEIALVRAQQIGIVLLAGLMCLAFYNDIVRWFL